MKSFLLPVAAALIALFFSQRLSGQENPTDSTAPPPQPSKKYSLSNPVPDKKLRDLSPDRPDFTESPITVDAGHAQIETDFVLFNFPGSFFDEDRPLYLEDVTALNNNIKIGLTQQIDVQVLLPLLNFQNEELDSQTQLAMTFIPGVGLRFKFNLVGNKGSKFAMGAIPYGFVNLLNKADQLEDVGVAIPMSYRISQDVSIAVMGAAHGKPGTAFFTDHTLSLTFPILSEYDIKGFGEIVSRLWWEQYEWHYSVNAGVTYQPVRDIVLDAGAYVGLTELMPGLNVFTGIAFRL